MIPMILAVTAVPAAEPFWERVPPVPAYIEPCALPESAWGTVLPADTARSHSNRIGVTPATLSWNGLETDERTLLAYVDAAARLPQRPRTHLYVTSADCAEVRRIAATVAAKMSCRPQSCIVIAEPAPRPAAIPPAPPAPPSVMAPIATMREPLEVAPSPLPARPAPPPPPALVRRMAPRGRADLWVTNMDYPSAALRAGHSGTVLFRLDVNDSGVPQYCTVLTSSGSAPLDDTTCMLLMRRARFTPGLDGQGRPMPGSWTSRMDWQLPVEPPSPTAAPCIEEQAPSVTERACSWVHRQ